jgi:hypothetical protein
MARTSSDRTATLVSKRCAVIGERQRVSKAGSAGPDGALTATFLPSRRPCR